MAVLVGATGAFLQLRDALNAVWNVEPPSGGGLAGMFKARLRGLGLVLGVGFLLLVSLVVSAVLASLGSAGRGLVPSIGPLWPLLELAVSLGVITLLFAAIFRYVPDTRLAWRDVWTGAVVTALLFLAGKYLIGLYLGRSGTASSYGAAGSIVVLMVWVYYSAQIVLYGAEVTQVYARRRGAPSA